MAQLFGENNTKYYQTVPAQKIDSGEQNARIFVARDSYTGQLSATSTDVVDMMRIPKGARILDVKAFITGGAGSADVGWVYNVDGAVVDSDKFLLGLDGTSGPNVANLGTNLNVGDNATPFVVADEEAKILVTATSDWGTVGTIDLFVYYTVE